MGSVISSSGFANAVKRFSQAAFVIAIDGRAAKCFGLKLNADVIEKFYTPDAVTGEAEEPAPKPVIPPARKKSVFTYIMIMFIAAFLLMALSFFTHQRSNEEAMTQLETSFHATIQDIQENQEKLMALEEQLDAAREDMAAQIAKKEAKLQAELAE